MPALVIAGIEVEVLEGSWSRLEDEVLGEEVRAFDATLLSTERTAKVSYKGQLLFLTIDDAHALRALTPLGNRVTVTGELIDTPAQEITARVKLGPVQPFQHYNGVADGGTPVLAYVADVQVREA